MMQLSDRIATGVRFFTPYNRCGAKNIDLHASRPVLTEIAHKEKAKDECEFADILGLCNQLERSR